MEGEKLLVRRMGYVKHTTMALLMQLIAPMAVTAESKFLSLKSIIPKG